MQLIGTYAETPAHVPDDRPSSLTSREPTQRRWWRSERTQSLFLIGLIVLLANSIYLLHISNPNPINQYSGLGTISQPSLLPGSNYVDPNVGFTAQALGHRAALDWLHGQVPWWNPYEGVGAPLAGEMQSAAFFPLDALNLLSNGQVFFRIALEFLAGCGTYLLVRRFTRANLPAVVGGVAFALNGTYAWMFHAPANPIAFLPFLLLGIEWAREGALKQERKGWVLIAVALAFSLYAGFPEMAFLDGLLALLWLAVRLVGVPRRSLRALVQSLALGIGVGALLAAPILVAFLDYLPHADIGGHNGAFARASLSANSALPVQVMPYLFGPIGGFSSQDPTLYVFWGNIGGYLGVSLCAFGVIGLFGRRYRALRVGLAVWIVLGLARLVGVGWALDVINLIPGVKTTAFYRYAPPSWEMAIVVLAVLGLDDVMRREVSRWFIVVAGVVTLAICLLSWHVAQPVLHAVAAGPNARAWAHWSFVWAVVIVITLILVSLMPRFSMGGITLERVRPVALAALVVLDCLVMFATPEFSAPRQAAIDTNAVRYLERHLGQQRFFTLGPLAPNYGSYFGLSSLAVNDLPVPKLFENFVRERLDANVDPLTFTGTASTSPSGPSPAEALIDNLSAYQALGVKYVLLPSGVALPANDVAGIRQVYSDRVVDILELPHPEPLFGADDRRCTVRAMSVSEASVECPKPSTIVYRELSMPGWHAAADGRSLPVHANGPLFQSVVVPAGGSTVQFSFSPPHAELAFVAFLLGLVGLLLAWPPFRKSSLFSRPRHRIR